MGGGGFGYGGAMFAMSAASAITSILEGYTQSYIYDQSSRVFEANARPIEARNRITELVGDIEVGRITRKGGKLASESQAKIGASGQGFQGSAVAVMVANQTQIEIDKALAKFGIAMEKSYTTAEAAQERGRGDRERVKGRLAISAGYSSAFSQLLGAGSNYAQYKGLFAKK
jgi:hypothetical protein